MREFTAEAEDAGTRLDLVVASRYPQFSRSSLEALFDKKMIFVKHHSAKPSYKVHPGDLIRIDETYLNTEPTIMNLPVVYEDDDVVAIDKPAGILTHSKGALNLEPTVASFIAPKITDLRLSGNRAGIIHRLDRHTSGIIITAKNQQTLTYIQKQFSNRKVKKTYIAVVEGEVEPAEAIIDAPIARNPKRPHTFSVNAAGKPAVTNYKVIKWFEKSGKIYSLLELKPETGRTHQLRVHLAYIKHPVIGDRVYAKESGDLLLHASSLELTLPGGNRKIFQSSPQRIKDFVDR